MNIIIIIFKLIIIITVVIIIIISSITTALIKLSARFQFNTKCLLLVIVLDVRRTQYLILGVLWYLILLYSEVKATVFIVRLHFRRHFELRHNVRAHYLGSVKVNQMMHLFQYEFGDKMKFGVVFESIPLLELIAVMINNSIYSG